MEIIAGPTMDEFTFREFEYFVKGVNPNIKVKRSKHTNQWKLKI